MRKLLTIILLLFTLNATSQCISNQSNWMLPAGPYQPGDIVLFGGRTYINKSRSTNIEPSVFNSNWENVSVEGIGGSVDDYRLYLDTIECEHKIPNDKIKCDKQFFNVDFKKGNDKVDNKVLLKIKYNW